MTETQYKKTHKRTPSYSELAFLAENLVYQSDSGLFFWSKKKGRRDIAKPVGRTSSDGYLIVCVRRGRAVKRYYQLHRVAIFFSTGNWPQKNVRHINKNKTDNRINNLEEIDYTDSQLRCPRCREKKPLSEMTSNFCCHKCHVKYSVNRRKKDIRYKIECRLRTRFWAALKRGKSVKRSSVIKLTSCSIEYLKSHIESQFQPGMSWENYGNPKDGQSNGWHIDHIIPCAAFDLTDPEQQAKCFHYTNLQPLWARDNIRKKDKILVGAV